MVRNLVIFGGSSHPQLTESICSLLGIPPGNAVLSKFSVGETRIEIQESVRGKDVYIVQSGGGKINDHLMELLVMVSACKTASARKVTAILPLFPYSRQNDLPYKKAGAPLARAPLRISANGVPTSTDSSRPQSPSTAHGAAGERANVPEEDLSKRLARAKVGGEQLVNGSGSTHAEDPSVRLSPGNTAVSTSQAATPSPETNAVDPSHTSRTPNFEPQRGYRQWVAQAGTLVADLLTCAGTDHVITMDLHDPQYQGFFDIPVDNLYGRHLFRRYIERQIPDYQDAVIVSPDAGGAKRATAIADVLAMPFALIHKESRPRSERHNAGMLLVGDVRGKTAILIDDLADTSSTITRAARLLKKEGAEKIIALVTHGVLSGDAIERINQSALDKLVVTNSVRQDEHQRKCPKLEVLEVGEIFAEAIRRVHHGESISVLFQHD